DCTSHQIPLEILALFRLLQDSFSSALLFFSSFGYLLTTILLRRNYRYVYVFQDQNVATKKINTTLSIMIVHSIVHLYLASTVRIIFFDLHVSLMTFLLWRYRWEIGRPENNREQLRFAERG
ncbi:hypothetical protein PMAYCL1PPCAC_19213, partial [Pristionchus mayeri]